MVPAPSWWASRGRNPNTTAQTPNWQTALANEGRSTSRPGEDRQDGAGVHRAGEGSVDAGQSDRSHDDRGRNGKHRANDKGKVVAAELIQETGAPRRNHLAEAGGDGKEGGGEYRFFRGKEPGKDDHHRDPRGGGGAGQRPAEREAPADPPVPMTRAPAAARRNPTTTVAFLRPVASTMMPVGTRRMADHNPYMERTTPTAVKLDTLILT